MLYYVFIIFTSKNMHTFKYLYIKNSGHIECIIISVKKDTQIFKLFKVGVVFVFISIHMQSLEGGPPLC